jgi:hypothetical protein
MTNVKHLSKSKSAEVAEGMQEYLKLMANYPDKRPGGLEGKMFQRLDDKTSERQSLLSRAAKLREELQFIQNQDIALVGEIDALIDILVEAEAERRASPATIKR